MTPSDTPFEDAPDGIAQETAPSPKAADGAEQDVAEGAETSSAPAATEQAETSSPAPPLSEETVDPSVEERRQHARKGAQVNKLIRAHMACKDFEQDVYMYLLDMSEGGIRVNLDRPFPPDEAVRLSFTIEQIGTLDALVTRAWDKCLAGGTWVTGLEFQDPSPETTEQVRIMLDAFTPQGRRLRFRLRQIVSVAVRHKDSETWWNVTALDLSPDGLRVRTDEPLEEGETLDLNLFLDDYPDVETQATVVWQQSVGPERFEAGLKFVEISEEGAKVLQRYIDQCVGVA